MATYGERHNPKGRPWLYFLLVIVFLFLAAASLFLIPPLINTSHITQVLPPPRFPPPIGTPPPGGFPYALFDSHLDYPEQIPVNGSDLVTLTLAIQQHLVFGTATVGPSGPSATPATIPTGILPTDLRSYKDVSIGADLSGNDNNPIAWQLTTIPKQTLLSDPSIQPRHYLDSVVFRWNVHAAGPGDNQVRIVLTLYLVYANGEEHDAPIDIMSAPVAMEAIQPTAANTTLPPFRLPLIGAAIMLAILSLVGFLWNVLLTFSNVVGVFSLIRSSWTWLLERFKKKKEPVMSERGKSDAQQCDT